MRPALLALLLAVAAVARAEDQIVAVLPLDTSKAKVGEADVAAIEEMLRSIAGTELQQHGYTVLTGETTLRVLKDNGVDAAKACEASCALEAARELKAKLFLSGSLLTSEGFHIANVRLFDSVGGKILASTEIEGDSVRSLRQQFKAEATSFFQRGLSGRKLTSELPTQAEGRIGPSGGGLELDKAEVMVRIGSEPEGALVLLNGTVLCQSTPCSKFAAPGVHELTFQKEGYETLRQKATFQKGTEVRPALVATFATLELRTRPAGLEVKVDGGRTVKTPATLQLDPGTHEVVIADACHLDSGERVNLVKGQVRALTLEAVAREAGLKVLAEDERGEPVEAEVMVDGARVGTAPDTFKVSPCARKLELRAPGGRGWEAPLALKEREIAEITARLKVLRSGITVNLGVAADYNPQSELRLESPTDSYGCTGDSYPNECAIENVVPGRYDYVAYGLRFPVEVTGSGRAWMDGERPFMNALGRFLPLLGLSLLVPNAILLYNAPSDTKMAYAFQLSTGVTATLGGLTVAILAAGLDLAAHEFKPSGGVRSTGEPIGDLGRIRLRVGTGVASGLGTAGLALDVRTFLKGRVVLSLGYGMENTTTAGLALAATYGPPAGLGGPFVSGALTHLFDDDGTNRPAVAAGWEFHPGYFESLRLGLGAYPATYEVDPRLRETQSAFAVWPEFSYGLSF